MMRLQGVGPKTVAMLHRELGVQTLDDLQRAALDGRVRAIKGMGAKKEALILKAIDERKEHAGRHLLSDAHDAVARAIVALLQALYPAAQITPVGSLRRGCETCGDIDILASGADPSIMDAFVEYPAVERVLGQGETKSSILLRGGIQVDLRLVPAESRGAADAVLHGLEVAQHRAARPRDRARVQTERVRTLPHRGQRHDRRRHRRRGSTRRSGWRGSRRNCARTAARSTQPRSRAAPPGRSRRSSRRSAHAQDGDRRARHRRRHGAARARGRPRVHGRHRSQPVARDGERARRDARARARRQGSRARPRGRRSGCWPASSATSAPTAPWTSPTTAWRPSTSWSRRCIRPSTRTVSR